VRVTGRIEKKLFRSYSWNSPFFATALICGVAGVTEVGPSVLHKFDTIRNLDTVAELIQEVVQEVHLDARDLTSQLAHSADFVRYSAKS
jgi:hypothetical protein